ncbi:MAG: TetR/AcrR family transcriptional regulator [Pseudomonadota bacterium]|nr:TetR/AcrR family transcriptional regulator [Pseudomonadota bacterium]
MDSPRAGGRSQQLDAGSLALWNDWFHIPGMTSTAPRAAPGRPREFDPDDAVRDALEVFRQRGYHGASMVDLIEGTRLSRGSLYKAFPDKRALFFAAFDLYAREALQRLREKLGQGNAREGVRTALLHYAHSSAQACWQKGCLISTATGELLPDDDEARRKVEAYYASVVSLLADAVRRGQAEGVIDRGRDPQTLARYLQTVIQGLRFVAKTGAGEGELREVVAAAMLALTRAP